MKKSWLMFASIILITNFVFSQAYKGKGKIKGYVYDEEGNPLEEVRVKLLCVLAQGGFEVVTDKNGEWIALWIRGGDWNIDFEKAGYEPEKISVQVKELERIPDIEIRLNKIEGISIAGDMKAEFEEGNKMYEEEKYEEAIEVYQKILQKYPEVYIIYLNIGNSFFQMKRYEEAMESYRKVLEQDENRLEALIAIGNSYLNLGQTNEAMEWYNKVKFEEIQDATMLYNVGSSFYENSRLDDALKYYRRAVEIQNDFLEARYQLGLTLISLVRYREALSEFEEYLKIDPDSSKAAQVKSFIEYLKKEVVKKKEST